MNTRVAAKQGVLTLAVALREVFPAVWIAQEVLARTEAVQNVLTRTVSLQEVLTCVLVVREVLARAVNGWDVSPAVVAMSETITSADQGVQGVHTRHQGPCTPLPPRFRHTATRAASVAKRAASTT